MADFDIFALLDPNFLDYIYLHRFYNIKVVPNVAAVFTKKEVDSIQIFWNER